MDLLGDHAEFARQVDDPPLALPREVVAEQFSDEAQVTHQLADPRRGEAAATSRRDEALGVEPRGDLCEVKSFAVQPRDTLRQAANIFQLCINCDRPGDLVVGLEPALPYDRHVVK